MPETYRPVCPNCKQTYWNRAYTEHEKKEPGRHRAARPMRCSTCKNIIHPATCLWEQEDESSVTMPHGRIGNPWR